jgi:hypothetical protein
VVAAAATAAAVAAQADFRHEQRAPWRCPVCASPFQMQPPEPRADNPFPRQAVPQDLIEIQPSYVQHEWLITAAAEAQGQSTKVDYLLFKLRELGAAPSKKDRAAQILADTRVRDEARLRGDLTGVDTVPGDLAAATAAELAGAAGAGGGGGAPVSPGPSAPWALPPALPYRWDRSAGKPPAPKCIVYSGFRTHLDVIDLALTAAGVNFKNIARMGLSRGGKDVALASFRRDPHVSVLLLNRAAAEGLDLSFVSLVFVMEPLDNASLEQQVVSRAHRMGQRNAEVRVEVLAMAGTAEETLLDVQAELAARTAAAEEAEYLDRRRRRRSSSGHGDGSDDDSDDSSDDIGSDNDGGDGGVRTGCALIDDGRLMSMEGGIAATASGSEGDAGGIDLTLDAGALSRQRVLQSLKLVPVPKRDDDDDDDDGCRDDEAAAVNTAVNVAANAHFAAAASAAAAAVGSDLPCDQHPHQEEATQCGTHPKP